MTKPLLPDDTARQISDLNRRLTAIEAVATGKAARGVVARQTLTANSSVFGGDSATAHILTEVPAFDDRLYVVHLKSEWVVTAGSIWDLNLHDDNTLIDSMANINTAGAISSDCDGAVLWEPSTGLHTVDIRVDFIGGSGTFQLKGSSTSKRHFWVEDIGPRIPAQA